MKRLGTLIPSSMLALLVVFPALAEAAGDAAAPNSGPGYGPMWGWGYGHHWGWGPGPFFHPFGAVLMVLLTVLLIVLIARAFGFAGYRGRLRHADGHGSSALDILEERFARGEIDKNEFDEKRKILTR